MQEVTNLLDSLDIKFTLHTHPPVFTCEQARKFDSDLKSARTKNLFLVSEKSKIFYLYILECEARADLKKLAAAMGKSRLTFGKDADLLRLLGLTPGSVSPFGLIHDTNHQITVLIDQRLTTYNYLSFHPNTNTATIEISWPDFKKFLAHTGHSYSLVPNT